jgi:subtilisin family serine protease
MKRVLTATLTAALFTLIASVGGTYAGATAPAGYRSVIVKLREQADLSGLQGSQATRLHDVVARSQATAARSQLPFAKLARAWEKAGRVTSFTPFWVFNGFALTAAPDIVDALSRNPAVASVTPDATTYAPPSAAASTASPEWNISLVNAPALWDRGFTGQGVVVASLDTGVDVTHPDLAGRWRGGTDSWYDPFGQHPTAPVDLTGHGTQVMGLMVGGDAGGTSVGVAPGSKWIAARIYNDQGQGTASNTHLAFQWLLDPDHDPNTHDAPQVVVNSWTYGSGCNLEFAQDIQTLRAAGILPVFAAGNYGSVNASPANNPGALAVGATTSSDTIASFSSRGPSACGEPSNTFPELTAPGVSVRTTDLYDGYTTQSGTSLSAPHVAGALALLLSAYPNLNVALQESALEQGSLDLGSPGADNTFGYGRLDVLGAYNAAASPDFTLNVSPASASTAAGGAVSYTVAVSSANGFAGDVALSLAGLPETQASWTFSPATVTGGSGGSQLTITTAGSIAEGSYPFTVTGTSGALSHTVNATLVVAPPPDFTLSAAPTSVTTTAGGTVTYTIGVMSLSGFVGDVALSLTGLDASQAGWSFAPATVAGGSGSSQLTIATSASIGEGSYPLTITGTSGGLNHAANVTLVVSPPPDFGIAASPSTATTVAGGGVSYSVTVSPLNGFAGDVSLSLGGLTPQQASWSFNPTTVAGGAGTSQLTITTAASLAPGTYPLTVTGAGGTISNSTAVSLVVTPPADFTFSLSPSSATVRRNGQATYVVTATAVGGFARPVNLSVSGLPSGVTGSFSANPVVPTGQLTAGQSTLTVRAQRTARLGTVTITVKGTGGSKTHAVTATLRVTT